MLQEFKDFISRGNVVDLAVAVVIGASFTAVVTAFTDGILLQFVAAIVGEPNFDSLSFGLGDAEILYGRFLTALVSFLLVSAAVFAVVKAMQTVQRPEEEEPSGPTEVDLLTEIRDQLASRD